MNQATTETDRPLAAVLFDLDGTLVDSLVDIAAATNACLRRFGLPEHPEADYRRFVGNGIEALVQRALGPGAAGRVEEMVAALTAQYRSGATQRTRPFDGIEAVLDALASAGVAVGVVSNKPDALTQPMVRELFGADRFGFVIGACEAAPPKPDPTGILLGCAALGVPPSRAAYVGDSEVDVQAAKAAGMMSVAVSWGFRSREVLAACEPRHLVDGRGQLLGALGF